MPPLLTRREAAKVATALAVAAGLGSVPMAQGQEAKSPAATRPAAPADLDLARAQQNPESFMLGDPVTFKLETDGHSRDLVITSARDEQGKRVEVRVPSRCARIFRADISVDEFTRQGGLHWRFWDKPGKVQLIKSGWNSPGPAGLGELVMLLREDETVRLYTMTPDMRC